MIDEVEFKKLRKEAQGHYYDDSNVYGLVGPIEGMFPEYHTYRHVIRISQYEDHDGAEVLFKELVYDWDKHCVREEEFSRIVQNRKDFRRLFVAQITPQEYKKALKPV